MLSLFLLTGLATFFPKPKDFKPFIASHIYDLNYPSYLPAFFDYPPSPTVKLKKLDELYPYVFAIVLLWSMLTKAAALLLLYDSILINKIYTRKYNTQRAVAALLDCIFLYFNNFPVLKVIYDVT